MELKPLRWLGNARAVVRAFPPNARRDAGYQLYRVQAGHQPSDWKPMTRVGPRRAGDPYPRGRRVSGAVPGDAARSGLRAARLREEAPAHTTIGCGSGAVPPQGAARATRPPVGGNDGDQDHEGL